MSYGIQTFKSNGALSFSSDSQSFTLYDTFTIPAQANGTRSYTALAGCTIEIQVANYYATYAGGLGGSLPYNFVISYTSGYPIITWTRNPAYLPGGAIYPAQIVYVMIKTFPSSSNYGFWVLNNNNELIASDFTSNYKFVSQATYSTQTTTNLYWDSVATYNVTCNTWPLVFLENLENQMATIYSIYLTGTNTYQIRVGKNNNSIPRVFVFEKPTTISGYGLAIYNASNQLMFDTTSNVVNTKSYSSLTIPSTAVSSGGYDYRLLSTNALTTTGSLPTSSATCMLATAYFGGEVNVFGDRVIKSFNISIKRSAGVMYSGWVCTDWTSYPYDTYYPISSNTGFLPRIYAIDISQYL
jgi:hypothetical protein